jgi:hypothetical protein
MLARLSFNSCALRKHLVSAVCTVVPSIPELYESALPAACCSQHGQRCQHSYTLHSLLASDHLQVAQPFGPVCIRQQGTNKQAQACVSTLMLIDAQQRLPYKLSARHHYHRQALV